MPIQKTNARLWFENSEEENAYDDLMISNIELKNGEDSESPNFAIIASRVQKEKFTVLRPEVQKQLRDLANYDHLKFKLSHSLTNFDHWNLIKAQAAPFFCYMVLRELPIRNFYARSLVMFYFFYNIFRHYKFSSRGILSDLVVMNDPNLRTAYQTRTRETNQVSALTAWKAMQPGFVRFSSAPTFGQVGFLARREREVFWDGTMNQPILPLSDYQHRDMRGLLAQ